MNRMHTDEVDPNQIELQLREKDVSPVAEQLPGRTSKDVKMK